MPEAAQSSWHMVHDVLQSTRCLEDSTYLKGCETLDLEDATGCEHPHSHHRDDGMYECEAVDEFEVEDRQHCLVRKDDATSDRDIEGPIHQRLYMSLKAHGGVRAAWAAHLL